jgi:SAM-dependent methyltransferase
MAQITDGLRAVLGHPAIYNTLQFLVGANRLHREIVQTYLRPRPGARILDIGCGPGPVLDYMPEVDYVGIDLSLDYINAARRRHGGRGRFLACSAEDLGRHMDGGFDLVLASGLLHHLDDDQSVGLFATARSLLAPDGRLVTVDSSREPGQSALARFIVDRDRGCNVRDSKGYAALAQASFSRVTTSLRDDVLRIPVTLCFLECQP